MTRKFSSYGPIDIDQHYYAPRQNLIEQAYQQIVGEQPLKEGHYITIWAPRQRGKTWLLQQVMQRIRTAATFEVAILTLQSLKGMNSAEAVLAEFRQLLAEWFRRDFPPMTQWAELQGLFTPTHFSRPLILILDEFDTLNDELIADFVGQLRSMYTKRVNELDKPTSEKSNLLHGVALIGMRAALGVENDKGSPFNVQRGLHVPNLTLNEVLGMFQWYEQESGQQFELGVIERIFYETQGQPGLVSWLGELLTETYNRQQPTISMTDFEVMYRAALNRLPNNNILNIISKAKQEPYKAVVLTLFETQRKTKFNYDNPLLNFLYLNGVIDYESNNLDNDLVRFPSPFVQKRLFNYFSNELFSNLAQPYNPFEDLSDTITETSLYLKPLLKRHEIYLQLHHERLLHQAPRRVMDLKVYEAVYHFNLYMYLMLFLQPFAARVVPEFPPGNGKVDLLIEYQGQRYALELKSFATHYEHQKDLKQAAAYAHSLGLTEITLVMFVEAVDDRNQAKYETEYTDPITQVKVIPVFVTTGE